MNRSAYPLKLPISIKRAAERLAKEDGVSLNQWIAVAVAQKVGVIETAQEFFARRREKGDPQQLLKILQKAPKRARSRRCAAAHRET
ncbi:MAG TPA: hypothetical protein VHZ09_04065 [Acidobacteriaceae bacterium]|jgi:hypothetical protein|nr:hypothetical protein [Acidobacteriaceae bacterium]